MSDTSVEDQTSKPDYQVVDIDVHSSDTKRTNILKIPTDPEEIGEQVNFDNDAYCHESLISKLRVAVSVLIANNKRRAKRRTTKSEGVRSSKRIKVRTTNDKKRNADDAFEVDAIHAIQTYLKRGKLNHNNKEDSLAKEGEAVEKAPQAGYRLVFRKDYRGESISFSDQ